jgi:fructose-1,6-bisphosphatase/inositol monophosphatase family enzyme
LKLEDIDLLKLADIAKTAALEAGQYIENVPRNDLSITHKSQGGTSLSSQVVTDVDYKSQEIILKYILLTCEKWDLALLTEESQDDKSRFQKEFFWCIDPLDGTLPFTEGRSGYCVSIALVSKEGVPVVGVIYDPNRDILYQGIKGTGVSRNGVPWKGNRTLNSKLTLTYDRSFLDYPNYSTIIESLTKLSKDFGLEGLDAYQYGGAALNAIALLESPPALYFKYPTDQKGGGSLWDFAASACILKEADAYVRNFNGGPLDLNRSDSTFMNHEGILFASSEDLAEQVRRISRISRRGDSKLSKGKQV